jgi:hypothetical protein
MDLVEEISEHECFGYSKVILRGNIQYELRTFAERRGKDYEGSQTVLNANRRVMRKFFVPTGDATQAREAIKKLHDSTSEKLRGLAEQGGLVPETFFYTPPVLRVKL